MVEAPGEDSTMQEYHQKMELEKACLEEAGWCFTQAQLTPLLQTPFINIFGETGRMPKEIAKVLNGNFLTPPGCNEYAKTFLDTVYWPSDLQEVKPRLTEDYCWGWQKSMGGHRVISIRNPFWPLYGQHTQSRYTGDQCNHGRYSLIHRLYLWQMEERSECNDWENNCDFNVEKLQIILLFEADFNTNNKWIGRAICTRWKKHTYLWTNNTAAGNTNWQSTNASTNNYSMITFNLNVSQQLFAPTTQKAVMTASHYWQWPCAYADSAAPYWWWQVW